MEISFRFEGMGYLDFAEILQAHSMQTFSLEITIGIHNHSKLHIHSQLKLVYSKQINQLNQWNINMEGYSQFGIIFLIQKFCCALLCQGTSSQEAVSVKHSTQWRFQTFHKVIRKTRFCSFILNGKGTYIFHS